MTARGGRRAPRVTFKKVAHVVRISGSGVIRAEDRRGSLPLGAPCDMLRYDNAFQHVDQAGAFKGLVVYPILAHRQFGRYGGHISGRWASFRVQLADANDLRESIQADMLAHPEQWLTYRHPPGNSSQIVAVTLAATLASEEG